MQIKVRLLTLPDFTYLLHSKDFLDSGLWSKWIIILSINFQDYFYQHGFWETILSIKIYLKLDNLSSGFPVVVNVIKKSRLVINEASIVTLLFFAVKNKAGLVIYERNLLIAFAPDGFWNIWIW